MSIYLRRRGSASWPAACLAGLGLALAVAACTEDARPGGTETAAAVLIAAAQGQVGSDAAPLGGSPYGSYLAGIFAGNQRDLSMAADFMLESLAYDPDNEIRDSSAAALRPQRIHQISVLSAR